MVRKRNKGQRFGFVSLHQDSSFALAIRKIGTMVIGNQKLKPFFQGSLQNNPQFAILIQPIHQLKPHILKLFNIVEIYPLLILLLGQYIRKLMQAFSRNQQSQLFAYWKKKSISLNAPTLGT